MLTLGTPRAATSSTQSNAIDSDHIVALSQPTHTQDQLVHLTFANNGVATRHLAGHQDVDNIHETNTNNKAYRPKKPARLTHAAILHHHTSRFVCVRDSIALFGWHADDDAFDAHEGAVKLEQPVLTLLQAPELLDTIVVVLINGGALVLRADLAPADADAGRHELARIDPVGGDELARWAELLPLAGCAPLALIELLESGTGSRVCVRTLEPRGSGDTGASAPLLSVAVGAPAVAFSLVAPARAGASSDVAKAAARPRSGRRPAGGRGSAETAPVAHVTGCCCVRGAAERDATVAVLWSSGALQMWDVAMAASPVAQARCTRWLPLHAVSAEARAPTPPSALVALGAPQLILLISPRAADGSCVLQLWDTRYGMLHAQAVANEASGGGGRPSAARSQPPLLSSLCGGGRRVAFCHGDGVMSVSVPSPHFRFGIAQALHSAERTAGALAGGDNTSSSSLFSLPLGATPRIERLLPPPRKGVSIGPTALPTSDLDSWGGAVSEVRAREEAVLANLGAESVSTKRFSEMLSDFLRSCDEQAAMVQAEMAAAEEMASAAAAAAAAAAEANGCGGKKKKTKKRKRGKDEVADAAKRPRPADEGADLKADAALAEVEDSHASKGLPGGRPARPLPVSEGFYSSVCERCVRGGTVAWLQPLRLLLERGAPSGRVASALVAALCDARQVELLLLFVRHAADLDTDALVQLLRLALCECEAKIEASPVVATTPQQAADAVAAAPANGANGEVEHDHWEELLNLVVCAPRNDALLQQALRWLPLHECQVLLSRIIQQLALYARGWRAPTDTPSASQLVGWANVLLDAHAAQLLLHAPAHGLIHRLAQMARRHVQLCSAMKSLKGYLGQASLRDSQPVRPLPDYSVEFIEL